MVAGCEGCPVHVLIWHAKREPGRRRSIDYLTVITYLRCQMHSSPIIHLRAGAIVWTLAEELCAELFCALFVPSSRLVQLLAQITLKPTHECLLEELLQYKSAFA